MRNKIIVLTCLCLMVVSFRAQTTLEDYKLASSCMGYKLEKLVYNSYVSPTLSDSLPVFSYMINTRKGREYFKVDPLKKNRTHAFDQEKLATLLSEKTGKQYSGYKLPFHELTFDKKGKSVQFTLDEITWEYLFSSNELLKVVSKELNSDTSTVSPDKKKVLILQDHNLYLKDLVSGKLQALTTDGTELKGYGSVYNWYSCKDDYIDKNYKYDLEGYWSPDSKKIIVPVFDRTETQYMKTMKWAPDKGLRPHVISYERAMPGDTLLTKVSFLILDIQTKKTSQVAIEALPDFLGTGIYWSLDSKKAYHITYARGYTGRKIFEIDMTTGLTKLVLNEVAKTYVDVQSEYFEAFDKTNEFIWLSEQDGWNHLYLYDLNTGKVKNQVTKGEFVVRSVQYIDQENRKIYFMAGGREKDMDPYFKLLYVVNFDGTHLTLLTPENADHNITFIEDKHFFVDNYSRIDLPNTAVLRNAKNGETVMPLEKADISDLLAMGWKAPESFKVKGRDGKTDIYGVIYRPYNFDPTKSYPVIDGTYSGPHTIRSPKTFRRALSNDDVPLAQLGFIVVTVDGFGSAFRSKKFHDVSWKNLGDIGALDHIKAIKEMAKKYPYMDTTRVGIYGHSAGGYDAARALIIHPEFYKVSVSSAGCHDHRIDKVWWPEQFMGFPEGKLYEEQSNIVNASKLKGKLLLVHGDVDNNVNPVASLRFVAELIKNNKEFDLLIVPGQDHYTLYNDKYFIRKRWDYFVKNLSNSPTPVEFSID